VRRPLIVFGAGGLAREVAWLASRTEVWEVAAFVEDEPDQPTLFSIPVVPFADAQTRFSEMSFITAVGLTTGRRVVRERALSLGFREATLIDPEARIGSRTEIGSGSIVCAGVTVTVDVVVGEAAIVNLHATIGHDAIVESYVTVSPGANVSGWVTIRNGAYLGTGCQVIDGTSSKRLVVGEWSTVAGGACVTKDVAPFTMVAGVPAILKKALPRSQ
jgi:sugar O-acyltransferase (sialic acid O-acetyltransferase NeuD family)